MQSVVPPGQTTETERDTMPAKVNVRADRIEYELSAPWIIGPNLRPTVVVNERSHATISLWVHQYRDAEGRVVYGYEVSDPEVDTRVTGTDLSSGVGASPDLDETLRTLCSFMQHYNETSEPIGDDEVALGSFWNYHGEDYPLCDLAYEQDEDSL